MGDLSLKGGRKDLNKIGESWPSGDWSWFASHSSVFGPYRQRSVLQDLCHQRIVDELIFHSNARSRFSSIATPYVVSSRFNQGKSVLTLIRQFCRLQASRISARSVGQPIHLINALTVQSQWQHPTEKRWASWTVGRGFVQIPKC